MRIILEDVEMVTRTRVSPTLAASTARKAPSAWRRFPDWTEIDVVLRVCYSAKRGVAVAQ